MDIGKLYSFYIYCKRVVELYEKHHKVCSRCSRDMMEDDQKELLRIYLKYFKKDK